MAAFTAVFSLPLSVETSGRNWFPGNAPSKHRFVNKMLKSFPINQHSFPQLAISPFRFRHNPGGDRTNPLCRLQAPTTNTCTPQTPADDIDTIFSSETVSLPFSLDLGDRWNKNHCINNLPFRRVPPTPPNRFRLVTMVASVRSDLSWLGLLSSVSGTVRRSGRGRNMLTLEEECSSFPAAQEKELHCSRRRGSLQMLFLNGDGDGNDEDDFPYGESALASVLADGTLACTPPGFGEGRGCLRSIATAPRCLTSGFRGTDRAGFLTLKGSPRGLGIALAATLQPWGGIYSVEPQCRFDPRLLWGSSFLFFHRPFPRRL